MLTKTLSEAKKKQRSILIKAMNNDIGSIDSAKDSWNPAQISERAKDISYIRSLVDSWNPAQLNEALKMLDLPVIDTWNPAQIEEQRRNLVFYLTERTLTGNPITLKILGNLTPEVTGLKVTMKPIQSGTGNPSPTNIRPISGRTEAIVTRTGKNKAPINDFTISRGTVETFSPNLSAGNYSISFNATRTGSDSRSSSCRLIYDDDTNYEFSFSPSGAVKKENITATKPIKSLYMYSIGGSYSDSGNFTLTISNFQIEEGSTATSYEPYTAETHTHQYGQTVYGGEDDFVNGGAASIMGMVDLGDYTWFKHSTEGRFYTQFSSADNAKPSSSTSVVGNILCSQYLASSQNDLSNGKISIDATPIPYINIIDLTKSDLTAAQFKTAMDGVQLCYELATPTTISTSAEEITLLKGTNVLSTDGDSIELKYKQNF